MTIETCDLVGVKNGIETVLGKIPMPPKMKLRELIRGYFGGSFDNECSDASSALYMGEELIDWMITQGWKAPIIEKLS